MAPDSHEINSGDVPAQVFESFLTDLGTVSEVPAEVQERLRKALLGEKAATEHSLRAAILGEAE